MTKFFIGCAIGFEQELQIELQEIWPYLLDLDGRPHANPLQISNVDKGGIEIECPFHVGLQLNFFCKLSNRILWRLQEFKVRDFPKLFQRLQKIKDNSEFSFLKNKKICFEISASKSRLNNEKRIAQIMQDCFGPASNEQQAEYRLFLRMHDDLCVLSLDTSGEHLHFRQSRHEQGAAPLRETIAAFCARQLVKGYTVNELQKAILIDPMAGTATLLREAVGLYQLVERDQFAFQAWTWIPKLLQSKDLRKNYTHLPALFEKLCAFDRDPRMVQIAKQQLASVGCQTVVLEQDLFNKSATESNNINTIMNGAGSTRPLVFVISNPPYGERLKADFTPQQLLQQIIDRFNPQRVGLLLSQSQSRALPERIENKQAEPNLTGEKIYKYSLQSKYKMLNGGLAVEFCVYSVSKID